MQQLLTAKDLAGRYNCSVKTARRYMRRMEHMEKPLRVTDQAVLQWELDRTMGIGYDLPHSWLPAALAERRTLRTKEGEEKNETCRVTENSGRSD